MGLDRGWIEALVLEGLQKSGVPGLGVAIVDGSGQPFARGFGVADVRTSRPVQADSQFAVASVTKPFTVSALAVLEEEGRLCWDDPVEKFTPYFQVRYPGSEQLTIRDVVSQRSGLSAHDPLWYNSRWNRREILRRLACLGLARPNRTAFEYTNLGFILAGEIIETVSGEPYESFLERRIFEGTGMRDSGFRARQETGVSPHRADEGSSPVAFLAPPVSRANAALGLWTSPSDLCRWISLNIPVEGSWPVPLLSPSNLAAMQSPHIEIHQTDDPRIHQYFAGTPRLSYGLGWFLSKHRGLPVVAHTGALPGFRAHLALMPSQGFGVAVVANLNRTSLSDALVYCLLDHLLGVEHTDWIGHFAARDREASEQNVAAPAVRKPAGQACPGSAALLRGTYENPCYGKVVISLSEQGFSMEWAGYTATLIPEEGRRFSAVNTSSPLLPNGEQLDFLTGNVPGVVTLRFLDQEFRRTAMSADPE